jgi:hypothetical protein
MLSILLGLTAAPAMATPEPEHISCKTAPADTKLSVTFRPATSLRDLAAWLMSFSCKNVVFGEDVAANVIKVNVLSPNQLSPKQAMALFVDAVEATGLVVKQKANTVIISLGPTMKRGCPGTSATSADPIAAGDGGGTGSPSADADAPDLKTLMDHGIRVVDATHVTVKAEVMHALYANPMAMSRDFRVVPSMHDGRAAGLTFFGVRPKSFADRVGVRNRDRLITINGDDVSDLEKLLEVYGKLTEATKLELSLERGGKAVSLIITVEP